MDISTLSRRIRIARGEEPGDLLLAGGSIANVFTGAIERADVVIADGVIAGVGAYEWTAEQVVDIAGGVIAPGLIDAHMHIESTLLTPPEFARLVAPRGTTAVIADPHEIGNVLGVPGVNLMLELSEGLPIDCFFMAPSCVPASPFERAGAVLEAEDIAALLTHDRVLGLAEMMNFPGVINSDEGVLAKIAAAVMNGGAVDGHCPGLVGRDLVAYAASGIESEHECTTAEEALQRQALGMLVQVREGSMARNLDAMLPIITSGQLRHWALCTDDIHAEDLIKDGHIDYLLKRLVAAGVDPVEAIRHATYIPAMHYGLINQGRRGAVAPSYYADLAVFSDMHAFRAAWVIKDGMVIAQDGALVHETEAGQPRTYENTIHIPDIDPDRFTIPCDGPQPVIGVIEDQIVTEHLMLDVPMADGRWAFDPIVDLAMIACVQRHDHSGDMGVGLVRGFGFTSEGAFGSSVGHDAHNLTITGTNGPDMALAAATLREIGGGFVVVAGGRVLEAMPLPVAGLMATDSAEQVVAAQRVLGEAAASLGCPLHAPFGTLSFLALSVIPTLKITDQGLFDVTKFALVGP